MIHSVITISRDAVECADPSAKLLGSAALTKHGHSSCQTGDKHTQREPQGERAIEERAGDKTQESDTKRVPEERPRVAGVSGLFGGSESPWSKPCLSLMNAVHKQTSFVTRSLAHWPTFSRLPTHHSILAFGA